MNISTQKLKQFQKLAQPVVTSKLLPILSYLKFENGGITKNNLKQFVTMDIEHDEDFLIDEIGLFTFLSKTKNDTISITITGKQAVLKDGDRILKVPTAPIADYPRSDVPESGFTALDPGVIEAIQVCATIIKEDDIMYYKTNVFCGSGAVTSSDGMCGIIRKFTTPVPEMLIPKFAAGILATLGGAVEFSQNTSYMFFRASGVLTGFSKTEGKYTDITKLFDLPESPEFISIDRSELTGFNDTCNNLRYQSAFVTASLTRIDKFVNGSMINSDYETDLTQTLTMSPNWLGERRYNPAVMNTALKPLPGSSLSMFVDEKRIFLTDGTYLSLLMLFAPQN